MQRRLRVATIDNSSLLRYIGVAMTARDHTLSDLTRATQGKVEYLRWQNVRRGLVYADGQELEAIAKIYPELDLGKLHILAGASRRHQNKTADTGDVSAA